MGSEAQDDPRAYTTCPTTGAQIKGVGRCTPARTIPKIGSRFRWTILPPNGDSLVGIGGDVMKMRIEMLAVLMGS